MLCLYVSTLDKTPSMFCFLQCCFSRYVAMSAFEFNILLLVINANTEQLNVIPINAKIVIFFHLFPPIKPLFNPLIINSSLVTYLFLLACTQSLSK